MTRTATPAADTGLPDDHPLNPKGPGWNYRMLVAVVELSAEKKLEFAQRLEVKGDPIFVELAKNVRALAAVPWTSEEIALLKLAAASASGRGLAS